MIYLWFITNGPAGNGGDIPGDVIREMAVEFAKDSRFEVSSNFKFSNGWFEDVQMHYYASVVNLNTIIHHLYDVQGECMTRMT